MNVRTVRVYIEGTEKPNKRLFGDFWRHGGFNPWDLIKIARVYYTYKGISGDGRVIYEKR